MPVKWESYRYGDGARACFGQGFILTVEYDISKDVRIGDSAFCVTVFGRRLETRAESLAEGKALAERVARQWLAKIAAALGDGKG